MGLKKFIFIWRGKRYVTLFMACRDFGVKTGVGEKSGKCAENRRGKWPFGYLDLNRLKGRAIHSASFYIN
jgi:hypothetical protein